MVGYDADTARRRAPSRAARTRDRAARDTRSRGGPARRARLLRSRSLTASSTPSSRRLVNPGVTPVAPRESDRERHGGAAPLAVAGTDRTRRGTTSPTNGSRLQAVRDRAAVRGRRGNGVAADDRGRGPRARHARGQSTGTARAPTSTIYDVKGDVEAVLQLTGRAAEFRFEPATHPALSPGRTARIIRGDAARRLARRAASRAAEARRQETRRRRVRAASGSAFAQRRFRRSGATRSFRRSAATWRSSSRRVSVAGCNSSRMRTRRGRRHCSNTSIVFDVYRGKGVDSRQKSMGLGLILQDVITHAYRRGRRPNDAAP